MTLKPELPGEASMPIIMGDARPQPRKLRRSDSHEAPQYMPFHRARKRLPPRKWLEAALELDDGPLGSWLIRQRERQLPAARQLDGRKPIRPMRLGEERVTGEMTERLSAVAEGQVYFIGRVEPSLRQ